MSEPIVMEGFVPEYDDDRYQEGDTATWHAEDSGMALIVELSEGPGLSFVRLQSYNEDIPASVEVNKHSAQDMRTWHPEIGALIGKRVRVTVEALDGPTEG